MENEDLEFYLQVLIRDRSFAEEIGVEKIIEEIKKYSPILLSRFLIIFKKYYFFNYNLSTNPSPTILNKALSDFIDQHYARLRAIYDYLDLFEHWKKIQETHRIFCMKCAESEGYGSNKIFEKLDAVGIIQGLSLNEDEEYQFHKMKIVQPVVKHESSSDKKEKSSLKEIAMFYHYSNIPITRKNGGEIAKKYGYTSGEKLFQYYTRYQSKTNRTGLEKTDQKNKNKIELLENVVLLLKDNPEGQLMAKNDLKTLQDSYRNTEY